MNYSPNNFDFGHNFGGTAGQMFPLISSFGVSAPLAAPAIQNMATSPQALSSGAGAVTGGAAGGASSAGFGFNLPTAQLALGGIQTIGSLWNAFEANKLAKKQFAFQKDVTETNLRNQIQSYNTTLEDRSRSRAHTEGQSAETAQAYVDNNRLRR